ncbi:T9SS type A sorting domain-containing protein [Taibaiella soli]|uniref:Secretion system C-terminal sorting domain-containing protein n=1 Tax=Taibaiella soli TaxID=1649169 RepID=A0A2W2B7J5_9BACT|nr:T9SS type A sorting domain-containing protein [Taibaiella soli]PZF72229.1 hypothetical protein DN068_14965 [Taibaiella soli]
MAKNYSKFFYTLIVLLLPIFGMAQSTIISENFQGWTSVGSYSSSTAAGPGNAWAYTNCIIAPGGVSSGVGSAGYVQAQASGGILTLPVVANGGVGTLNINARVSGTSGGFVVEKKIGSGSWTSVQTVTTSATSGTAFSVPVNDNSASLQLRINNNTSRALYIHDVSATSSAPVITVSTTSLAAFSTGLGASSATQSYTVSAINMTANLSITAPAGFTISTSSTSNFGSTLSLTPTSGNLATTTIYVRMTGAAIGSFNGNIVHATTGATSANVAVTGAVAYAAPVVKVASNIGATSFSANWSPVTGVTSYLLDVSTNAQFATTTSSSITEGFDTYTGSALYNGWVFDNTISNYTSGASPNSVKFLNSGTVGTGYAPALPANSTATELKFTLANNGSSGSSFLVEGLVNGTWTTVATVLSAAVPTSGTATFTYNATTSPALPAGITQFRFTYNKNTGNFGLDDVMTKYNTAVSSMISGYNGLQVNDTTATVSGLTTGTPYYYRVRATDGTITSPNSATIKVTPLVFNKYHSIASGDFDDTYNWQGWDGAQWINYPLPPHDVLDSIAIDHNIKVKNDITVKNLALSNNVLSLGDNNLTVTNQITGGSASSYVKTDGNGTLKMSVGNTPVFFPVGNGSYNPATLTNAGYDNFSIKVGDVVYEDGHGASSTTVTNPVVNHTWYITPDGAGNNVTMTLQWNAADEINDFNRNHTYIRHYNGTAWEDYLTASGYTEVTVPGGHFVSNNVYDVIQANISNFSPFTVGAAHVAPLAITLTDINAVNKGNANLISWKTASADASDIFTLERSQNGKDFVAITSLPVQKSISDYQYTDTKPFNGVNYYRLKMTDKTLQASYSKVVIANTVVDNAASLNVYPNPATDNVTVYTGKSAGTITIADLNGKILKAAAANTEATTINTNDLAKGVYILRYTEGTSTQQTKLVK